MKFTLLVRTHTFTDEPLRYSRFRVSPIPTTKVGDDKLHAKASDFSTGDDGVAVVRLMAMPNLWYEVLSLDQAFATVTFKAPETDVLVDLSELVDEVPQPAHTVLNLVTQEQLTTMVESIVANYLETHLL